jgi:hypothetical protein
MQLYVWSDVDVWIPEHTMLKTTLLIVAFAGKVIAQSGSATPA